MDKKKIELIVPTNLISQKRLVGNKFHRLGKLRFVVGDVLLKLLTVIFLVTDTLCKSGLQLRNCNISLRHCISILCYLEMSDLAT